LDNLGGMRKSVVFLPSVLLSLLISCFAFAKEDERWEFVDSDEGVRTWKLEVPGRDLPGFRGQTMIDATPAQILQVMLDRESHTQWMYHCAESLLLKKIDEQQAILYNRTAAPWPVWDRDVIVLSKITKSDDGKKIDVTFQRIDSDLKKLPDRVVRMPKLSGYYKLRAKDDGKTEVTYQIESDIGGSLPAWLAQRAAKALPYETLSRLRKRVEQRK
jgi:hypothetical protein